MDILKNKISILQDTQNHINVISDLYNQLRKQIVQKQVFEQYSQLEQKLRYFIEYEAIQKHFCKGLEDLSYLLKFYFQFLNNFMLINKQTCSNNIFFENFVNFSQNEDLSKQFLQIIQNNEFSENYFKFFLIFSYNLIKNNDQLIKNVNQNEYVIQLIKILFERYFQIHKNTDVNDDEYFEWIFYILKNILEKNNNNLKLILNFLNSENKKNLLLLIFNIFNKIIEDRIQGHLIYEIYSHIKDIDEKYNNKNEILTNFTISQTDLVYLIQELQEQINNFSNRFQQVNEYNQIDIELDRYLSLIHIKLKILCQVSFLGGYNKRVQDIMVEHHVVDMVHQLLVILFNNSKHYLKEEKIKEKEIEKLIHKDNYFEIFSSILRIVSNLCHLHQECQQRILDNDYLALLLSLSECNSDNPMAREWSVVLVKNLTEANQVIQNKIDQMRLIDFDHKTSQFLHKFGQGVDTQQLLNQIAGKQARINAALNNN